MQIQSAHNRKLIIVWSRIPTYIVLPDKIGELHTEPIWTKQNISCRMEVSSPIKSPLCTSEVLPIPLSECPWRNQHRMFLKEPKHNVLEWTKTECPRRNQNLGAGLPHPIHQDFSGNKNTLHVHMHTYPESFIESYSQKFHRIT